MSGPVAHSLYGMSVMERRIACAGSAAAERGRPDRKTEAADRGTRLHDVAARALQTQDPLVPYEPEDPDDCAAVVQYVETVLGELKRYEQMALVGDCAKPVLYVEQKFALDHMHDILFGTADAVIVALPWIHVFDFKTGGILVDLMSTTARISPQLGGYLLGAIRSVREVGTPSKFRLTVVQPARGGAKTIEVSRKQIAMLASDIMDAVEAGEKDGAPRTPGEHCTFCRARVACPELREAALAGAQAFFDDEDLSLPTKEVVDLTDEELAKLLTRGENLDRWLKAVRAEAFHRLNEGAEVPGLKLVAKRAIRKWKDEAAAIQRLKGEGGLEDDDLYSRKLKSPAQIEKLDKALKPVVADLAEAKSSGAKLVPADHPGDPLPRGAAAVFDDYAAE